MRSVSYFLLLILHWILCACSVSLDVTEIEDLNKVSFDSLYICPDIELYNFRIDIIRQTSQVQINDSSTETKDVAYHQLGFDLGNGLFYDLHDNLSLRIDYLLNINNGQNFRIQKLYEKSRWNREYFTEEGEFIEKYIRRDKKDRKFRLSQEGDNISVFYKKKYRYSILLNDSSIIFRNKKRIFDELYKKDANLYCHKRKRKDGEYKVVGKEMILDDNYRIVMSPGNDVIDIFAIGRKRDVFCYRIIRSKNKIFIHNEKFFGKKIIIDKDGFTLYSNDELYYSFKKVPY